MVAGLLTLPGELFLIIAEFLPVSDHVNLEATCSYLRERLMADRWKYVHFSLDKTSDIDPDHIGKRCLHRINPFLPQSPLHSYQNKFMHFRRNEDDLYFETVLDYFDNNKLVTEAIEGFCISGGLPSQVRYLLEVLQSRLDNSSAELVVDLSDVSMDPQVLNTLNTYYSNAQVLLGVTHMSSPISNSSYSYNNELIQDVPVKHKKIYGLNIEFNYSTRHLFHSLGKEPFMDYVRELGLFDTESFQVTTLKLFLQNCSHLRSLTLSRLGSNRDGIHWLPDTVRELHIIEPSVSAAANKNGISVNGKNLRHLFICGAMSKALRQFKFSSLTHLTILTIPESESDVSGVLDEMISVPLRWLKIINLERIHPDRGQLDALPPPTELFSFIGKKATDLETLVISSRAVLSKYSGAIEKHQLKFPKLKLLIFDGNLRIPKDPLELYDYCLNFSNACPQLSAIYVANLSIVGPPTVQFPNYIKLIRPARMRPKENKILTTRDVSCIINLDAFRKTKL